MQSPNSSQEWSTQPAHYIWVLSASTSIVTSRYTLETLNWHYPLHLLSLQLFCSIVANLCLVKRDPDCEETTLPGHGCVRQFLSDVAFSVSMPLFIQAILHTPNFPTLCMLSLLAFLPSLIISLGNPSARSFPNIVRLILFVLGTSFIIADDYRLSVSTVSLTIPAVLITGIQSFLADVKPVRSIRSGLQKTCMALIVSLLLCYRFEITRFGFSPFLELDTLDSMAPIVLFLNLISTTAVLCFGDNIISPTGFEDHVVRNTTNDNNWFVVALSVMTTALTAAGVILTGFLTSITSVQCLGYFAVILCILNPNSKTAVQMILMTASRVNGTSNSIYCKLKNRTGLQSSAEYVTLPVTEVTESLGIYGRDTGASYSSHDNSIDLLGAIWTGAVAFVTCVCCVVIFREAYLGTSRSLTPEHSLPILDTIFSAPTDLEIVISMYKESVETVLSAISTVQSVPFIAARNPRISIYTKDEDGIDESLAARIPANFAHLPNIGREGETYLNHILTHWDNLANQTIFLQAELHNPTEISGRLQHFFGLDTGMLSLGFSGHTCDCESCSDGFGWTDSSGILSSTYARANNVSCGRLLLAYKGQFVASAKRIRGVDRAVYQDLHRAFVDPGSWAHSEPYLQGEPDTMSRPRFGYTMERLWSGLLQCSNERIARDCPTLLGAWRRGGDRADCQCFDHV